MLSRLKDYIVQIADIMEFNSCRTFLGKIGLLLVAFFTPILNIILGVLFLVITDLLTGIIAAKKKNQKLTSSKLSRTISKVLVYLSTIIIVHTIQISLLLDGTIPLEAIVSAYIALTELKSILENLDDISKCSHGFISGLIHLLSNAGRKTCPVHKDLDYCACKEDDCDACEVKEVCEKKAEVEEKPKKAVRRTRKPSTKKTPRKTTRKAPAKRKPRTHKPKEE